MRQLAPAQAARFMVAFKLTMDHFGLTPLERLQCLQAARRDWGAAGRCYRAIAGSLGPPGRRQ